MLSTCPCALLRFPAEAPSVDHIGAFASDGGARARVRVLGGGGGEIWKSIGKIIGRGGGVWVFGGSEMCSFILVGNFPGTLCLHCPVLPPHTTTYTTTKSKSHIVFVESVCKDRDLITYVGAHPTALTPSPLLLLPHPPTRAHTHTHTHTHPA